MNVVLLGATRGMGRAVARRLARRGERIFLLGRDLEQLERSAADLEVRGARGRVEFAHCDLASPSGFADALDAADAALGSFDTFVLSAAQFGTQDELEADHDAARKLLTVNLANTIALCELLRERLLPRSGTLCVFSSVAGDRGRKPVGIYGASKAGLSHYLEALDHKYRASGLRTVTVKPGFVRTSMTEGLPAPPFAGEPDQVAKAVVKAIDAGSPVVYAPAIWGAVMGAIKRLPRWVMRRVDF
jgi:decaprenylphospho-beta-D-erythro-pentofuranosid-2-ulose 2-reductase